MAKLGCCYLSLALLGAAVLAASDDDVVFRSDVSLVRVDAQVLDRDSRAVTGLRAEDFILKDEGRPQQIRNFARENMPVDVLLLLDVSGSMRPHVETIASAAHQALSVLGANDRVAIMVFDRSTRLRLPFAANRGDVEREFERLLRQESFNGGTDITRGMLDAAQYVMRSARRGTRRAIVILTDDATEADRERNEAKVERALAEADAVMFALIAPDAMQGQRFPGGTYPGGSGRGGTSPNGTWGRGPSIGGSLGGIILGGGGYPRGGGYPGGGRTTRGGPRGGGPVMTGAPTHSAGTAEIARQSGGDSVSVYDASAFEDTLARIRQRYALHFRVPAGAKPAQERNIVVELTDAARRRYPNADVRYRKVYVTPKDLAETAVAAVETPAAVPETVAAKSTPEPQAASAPPPRRRVAVDESDRPLGPGRAVGSATQEPTP